MRGSRYNEHYLIIDQSVKNKNEVLVQPIDQIFVKVYGFLSFATNMGKYICQNISENWSGRYS